MDQKYDLEDRLLDYAAAIVRLVEKMSKGKAASHVGGQLLRSGTSPLYNHGEAQAAESAADFVHKLKICLKEFHESSRGLKLIGRVPLVNDETQVGWLLGETDEFIRIFTASIRTAEKRKGASG